MENRYLPILHENISLSVLPAYWQVSNEPLSFRGEWAVKIALSVNYFLLLIITKNFEILILALQDHASMPENIDIPAREEAGISVLRNVSMN